MNIAFQKGAVVAYLLLDSPKTRTIPEIEKRLEEMASFVREKDNITSMYGATAWRLNDEKIYIVWSNEGMSNPKKEEYDNIITEYVGISDIDRQKFIQEMQSPLMHYRPHLRNQIARQRED